MKNRLILSILIIILLASCTKIVELPVSQSTDEVIIPPTQIVTENPTATPIPGGVKINEIQGKAHRSPLEGETVENVFGIVTAKRGDGFYMQDPYPDDDPGTSEAIFVVIRGFPKMEPGDAILIKSAVVYEFNPAGIGENSLTITELKSVEYEILSSGNEIPLPTIIGKEGRLAPDTLIDDDINGYAGRDGTFDPETDGIDFYESLESMLIQVNNAVAVSATSSYNEIAVVPDLYTTGGVFSPRGAIILQEKDANPERVILDDSLVMLPRVTVGDTFTEPLVGIMDYTFGSFKLQLIKKPSVQKTNLTQEKFEFNLAEGQLSVATYNVENLDAARDPKRINVLADHIVNYLNSPDILALQEIQDNDGEVDSLIVEADQTYQDIIQAINNIGGPDYNYVNIDPKRNTDGGVPGGNIRVGFIYRKDVGLNLVNPNPGDAETGIVVTAEAGEPVFSLNPGRIDPLSYAFQESRKPLAVAFNFNGKKIYLINNHLNSKGGDGALFGDIQPPNLESEKQRMLQAKAIYKFVQDILTIDPSANVIVLGDLNDFPWSAPIKELSGSLLKNLVTTLPLNEQYTYIYEGNAQVLDQILVSSALIDRTVSVDVVHINSEFYYQDRLSDHDPVIAVFYLN